MSSAKRVGGKKPKGHSPSVRDLVSVRSNAKLKDLGGTKRRSRLSKLYGYKES